MTTRLLVVHHTASPLTHELLDAVLAGAHHPDIDDVDVRVVPALGTTILDVLEADGFLFGTSANFGYMSGGLKHFFDTVYYPCLGSVTGKPYGTWIHGNNDTVGAASAIEKICTGWGLVKVVETLHLTGADKQSRGKCYELGATVAAHLA